ncbi:MAG: phage/plasmid primase, P4 family [Magnetococcus sp. YQC-5]
MHSIDQIKDRAQGQWPGMLTRFGAPASCLTGKHGPCPFCGGTDRFRFDDQNGSGSFICSQCGSGDGMTFASRLLNLESSSDLPKVAAAVATALGIDPPARQPESGSTQRREKHTADDEKAAKRAKAAALAQEIVAACHPAQDDHPYLARKQVTATPNMREIDHAALVIILGYEPRRKSDYLQTGRILIILIEINKQITSIEMIDAAGMKLFLKDGAITGGWWATRECPPGDGVGLTVFIGEGVSTTRTAEMADPGSLGVAAMMNGNLPSVAVAIQTIYPHARIAILADLTKDGGLPDPFAVKAAKLSGAFLAVPDFGSKRPEGVTDFNDLMILRGMDEVWRQLSKAKQVETSSYESDLGNQSQFGLSARFVRMFGTKIRYCSPFKKWFVFDGKKWQEDATEAMLRMAKETVRGIYQESAQTENDHRRQSIAKFALRSEKLSDLNAMISLSKPDVPIMPEQFDANRWLFNVQNGTIDLKTGKLLPHNRIDFIRKMSIVAFNQNATAPTWEKFLRDIFSGDDELIRFIQKSVGYSMTGLTEEQCLFFLYGKGKNGKSTFTETLQAIFCDYAMRLSTQTIMSTRHGEKESSNDIARLDGMRMVITSEIPTNQQLNESKVKDLTGGDTITARFLYGEFFDFLPSHKLWIFGNHKPDIKGTDLGIWRRIRLIPFNVTFTDETANPKLKENLISELPGILNWMVAGCLLWQQEGLGISAAVVDATNEYRSEMDQIAPFIADRCVVGKEFYVKSGDLFKAYQAWCRDTGASEVNQKRFGTYMTDQGFTSPSAPSRVGGTLARLRYGIALLDDSYTPPVTGVTGCNGFAANSLYEGAQREKLLGRPVTTRNTRNTQENVVPIRPDLNQQDGHQQVFGDDDFEDGAL